MSSTDCDYAAAQQVQATAWKARTPTLPEDARPPAPWINHDGQPRGRYAYCLPPEHAARNLLPGRGDAVALFAELGIPWHCGIDGGPGNHLLSSQVQCVNALFPMVQDPQRIQRAFGEALDIDEVLAIEPGRYLTFEYIGPQDYFNEGAGGGRTRGAHCTSFDAAFRYRTSTGAEELALVEWKYTESYRTLRDPNPARDRVRLARYGDAYTDPTGPLRSELLDIGWMFDEPFYQLMRQQLLAWQLERDGVEGLEAVRVLHVLPPANLAYQQSLPRHQHRGLGTTVDEVWGRLLGATDRFQRIDPAVFLDETVTCNEYLERYA